MTLNLAFFLLIAYWLGFGSAALVSEERSDDFATTLIVGLVFLGSILVTVALIIRGLS
jgi:hypothetical protein